MSYVLRVVLPDRPGSLGAVATALGLIDADILAMDIVERFADKAVDDIVVDLPNGRAPDVLITAAETVPGVWVESVRPDPGVADRHREWELVEAIATDPAQALVILVRMLPKVLRAGWAVAVRVDADHRIEFLAGGGGVPRLTDVEPGWAPVHRAGRLDPEAVLGAGGLEGHRHRDRGRPGRRSGRGGAGGPTRRTGAAGVRGGPAGPSGRAGRHGRRPDPATLALI